MNVSSKRVEGNLLSMYTGMLDGQLTCRQKCYQPSTKRSAMVPLGSVDRPKELGPGWDGVGQKGAQNHGTKAER